MLSESQINGLKKTLDVRFCQVREEIRQELIRSDNESYIDLAGRVHDFEEAAVADILVDLQLASIDRHIHEIREIDSALMRIAGGSYGVCEDCGETIAVGRLTVNPAAKRCYRCQNDFEVAHNGSGGPSL